jgi:hypothetical protein
MAGVHDQCSWLAVSSASSGRVGMVAERGMTSGGRSAAARTGLRARFWAESAFGAGTGTLAVITLFWKDWIEAIFGVDPDRGNGSLEWLIVAALAVTTIALAAAARVEWHRAGQRLGVSGGQT